MAKTVCNPGVVMSPTAYASRWILGVSFHSREALIMDLPYEADSSHPYISFRLSQTTKRNT